MELNPAWEKTLGWSTKELCAKPFLEFIHPDDQAATTAEGAKLGAGGATIQFQNRYRHKDGSYRWFMWMATACLTEKIIIATARDITEQKSVQAETIAKEKELEILLASMLEGVVIHDSEGKIIEINQTALNILGTGSKSIVGQNAAALKWKAIREDLSEVSSDQTPSTIARKTGIPQRKTTLGIYQPTGELRWVSINAVPLFRDGEKKPYRILVTFIDITEERKQKALLNSLIENIPVAIFMKDKANDLKFNLWNKSAEKLFGLKNKEVIGKNDHDFFPKAEADAFRKKDLDVLANNQESLIDEEKITLPNGEIHYLRTKKVAIDNNYLLGVSEDITSIVESKKRLGLVLASVQMGVWDWDLITNDLIWDESMYRVFQVDKRDFTGTFDAWSRTVHPDDLPISLNEIQLAKDGTKPFDTRFRIILPTGEVRIIAAKATVERSESGQAIRMRGVNWDVTEQAKTELELRETLNAIDQASIMSVTNADGKIISVNDNFCKISGYSREELIGADHRIVNSKHHSKHFFKQFWETIKAGKIWKSEIKNKSKHGNFYWVQTAVTPAKDLSGKITKFISLRFDITAQKEAQQQMLQSSKMSSLGEMAGGIAHEINNPLAVIHGKAAQLRSRILAGKFEAEKFCEDLDKIENTAGRIAKIIKGLRSFSRNSEGDPMASASITQIIDDSLELCRERFKNNTIELRSTIESDFHIECRAVQISQVLMNLLNNAYDAVERLPEKWVHLNVKKTHELVEISVTDSGHGIANELIEKIMQPFFTTKPIGKGTGLGLSISKGIIEEHRGDFYYDPSCANTRFVIRLPLLQPKNSA